MAVISRSTTGRLIHQFTRFRWWQPASIAIVIAAMSVLLLWKLPQWQAARASDLESSSERIALENELRKTMATVIAGALVLSTGYFTWRSLTIAQQSLVVSQQGQITDRFSKAIEQLGASHSDGRPRMEVRLGAIYALERIAADSSRDHSAIMEVLTAYVRENTTPATGSVSNGASDPNTADTALPALSVDIKTIMTVIGRRSHAQRRSESFRLDLSGSNLRGAEFNSAEPSTTVFLDRTIFNRSNLERANFRNAHLTGAMFEEAVLSGANFGNCNLENTNFYKSGLERTSFHHSLLEKATFRGRDLTGMSISHCSLVGTTFAYANLAGTQFNGSDLTGASFDRVHLERSDFAGVRLYLTKFNEVFLDDAVFNEADLRNATFSHVQMHGTLFMGANLQGAKFTKSSFRGAQFLGARLEGASLEDVVDLTQEQIELAFLDEQTRLPLGLVVPQNRSVKP